MPDERTAYVGATLIDGTGAEPLPDAAVVVEDSRIAWVGSRRDLAADIATTDASGKFMIPGLLDANAHMLFDGEPGTLSGYEPGQYDELILESAQIALRAGVTSVFDTYGPLEPLRRVRDSIRKEKAIGARVFLGGNIIGLNGPWSDDFPRPPLPSDLDPAYIEQVNAAWEQGMGRELLRMPAEQIRPIVRDYITGNDLDFVKYASSAHAQPHLIAFAADSQRVIVEEAHAAGLVAQACTMSPGALSMAIDAGVDLLQHGDVTGPYAMPDSLVDLIVERKIPCAAFLETAAHTASQPTAGLGDELRKIMLGRVENDRRLIERGAKLLLAHDMGVLGPDSPMMQALGDCVELPFCLGESHIYWFKAAIECGMTPMNVLLSATRNIAEAYAQSDEIGSIEPGKKADIVLLDADPLENVENYARIAAVIKDGKVVDRDRLPENPIHDLSPS